MVSHITLGEIAVDVVFKDIKNVHLSVYPPTGRVRISAPSRMSLDTVRVFAVSKLGWIKRQQLKLRQQERETPREYRDHESHYVWGQRYRLHIVEIETSPIVELQHKKLLLRVRPGSDEATRRAVLDEWYRATLKYAAQPLVSKWEPLIGVKISRFFVQRLKTRWGSCNPEARSIRLNTDLVKKPSGCLEYVIVHELTHLVEPTHSSRFVALMEQFMPNWKFYRSELNQLPVRHEEWKY
jgi:predicted metal-dependent hydrolase